MLSELAINDPKTFSELVKQANDALNGKVKKTTVKKEETKKEVKKEKVDYSKMTVAELKKVAKEKNIENYSKMKKDELLKALK